MKTNLFRLIFIKQYECIFRIATFYFIFNLNLRKLSFNIEPVHWFYLVSPIFDWIYRFELNLILNTTRNRFEERVMVRPVMAVFQNTGF